MTLIPIRQTTQKLLDYLPGLINKIPPTKIVGTKASNGTGTNFNKYLGASKVFEVMDSVGFILENYLNDIQNAKQEAYIGYGNNLFAGESGGVGYPKIPLNALPNPTFGVYASILDQTGYAFTSNPSSGLPFFHVDVRGGIYYMAPGGAVLLIKWVGYSVGWVGVGFIAPGGFPTPYTIPVPGADGAYLDNVGISYGVPRTPLESDKEYKKRIRAEVVGDKVTIEGLGYQISTVFGYTPSIYDWNASSYQAMLPTLTANYCAFDVEGNPYSLPTDDLNYPVNGNPFNFYVVLPSAIVNTYSSGVYAGADDGSILPSSFYDWQDPKITASNWGGFFNANSGEITTSNLQTDKKILQILQSMKAAGTNPILVLQNCE